MGSKPLIPIICGPTGAGKTGAAVALAARFPIEVISADSRQIVRHLDIGTAKPTVDESAAVAFHLVDIIEPGERYTAFRFIDEANAAIADILNRRRVPVVVGGTGLYLRALTEGIVEIEDTDLTIRERLEREMEEIGPEAMYARLEQVDPLEAAKVHPNNRVRVIRALEIFELTGRSRSELAVTGRYRKGEYDFAYFCLAQPRDELYRRINERVDCMMAAGLLEEVKRHVAEGRQEALCRANVIGYNELLLHLDGQFELDEAIALIKQNHRRYAKRQLTWFRHQVKARLFDRREALEAALIPMLETFG